LKGIFHDYWFSGGERERISCFALEVDVRGN